MSLRKRFVAWCEANGLLSTCGNAPVEFVDKAVQLAWEEVVLAAAATAFNNVEALTGMVPAREWDGLLTAPATTLVLLGPRDSPVVGYVTHHSPDPARRTNAYILVLEDLTGSFKPVRYICQEWAPI